MTTREWTALVAVALALFLGSWSLLHQGFLGRDQITDIPTYVKYGDAVKRGQVPYRDFELEYPPFALPTFVIPTLRMQNPKDDFGFKHWFDRGMAICGCLALIGTALCLRAVRAGPTRATAALGLLAVSPLLLGSVVLTRFDFWPTALAVLALAALLWQRRDIAAVLMACAIGAKLWPAVLLPLAVVWLARTQGRRVAAAWTAVVGCVLAAIFLPFVILSPGGVAHSFHAQLGRPLQLESLGSSVLIAAHHLAGTTAHVGSGFGSQNLTGPGADAAALATSIAGILALIAVWVLFARGPATGERLLTHSAASIAAVIAFGKVLSPQFMVWLIPFVVLAPGVRGLFAGLLLMAGLVLTQSWFPRSYWALAEDLAPVQSGELLARNLVLLALLVVLVWPKPEPGMLGEQRSRLEALQRVRTQVE